MPSISIVGIGRVGGALAIALSRSGYALENLVYRTPETAEQISNLLPATSSVTAPATSFPQIHSDIILIATADPDIRPAAEMLVHHVDHRPVVLHTSGSLSSSDVLAALSSSGCAIGSMHPLVSISDAVSGSDAFSNAFFCVEGDDAARMTATSIVESLGGRSFSIRSENKALYHAAAVTASGHFVALVDAAIEMLTECGVDSQRAQEILLPLIQSTVDNLESQRPARALTGTFARGDFAAFERHLGAMEKTPKAIRDIYLLLGERSLELAASNGAKPEDLQKIRERISIAKRKSE